MNLAAAAHDSIAHSLDYDRQTVGAYMRMSVDENIGRRAMLTKYLKYLLHVAALLGAGVEFAVGERARSALAEAIVGIGVNHIVARNLRHVNASGIDILTALKYDGAYAKLYQPQSGEESGRARSHYYSLRSIGHIAVDHGTEQRRLRRLLPYVGIDREVDHHAPLTGVDGTFLHYYIVNAVSLYAKGRGHLVAEHRRGRRRAGVNAELYIVYHIVIKFMSVTVYGRRERP